MHTLPLHYRPSPNLNNHPATPMSIPIQAVSQGSDHSHMTFHIPSTALFEEAATVPLTAMRATMLLYLILVLPQPWSKPDKKMPLVIYGAASAVGA